MSGGFPVIPTRAAFGPTMRDRYPVENPETDLSANQVNLVSHQSAGLGMVAPRALLVARYVSSELVIVRQAESWNADGSQAHPVLTRVGAGIYRYTFAASYLDRLGAVIPTALYGAFVAPWNESGVDTTPTMAARLETGDPLTIRILSQLDAVATDRGFVLWVL